MTNKDDNLNIKETLVDIQSIYGYGDCAVFALVLSKIYNLPIVEFYSGQDMYHVALVVAADNLKNDKFIDVFGINSYKDIQKRYSTFGKQSIQVKDEHELQFMSIFDNDDIEQAKKDIEFMFNNGLLPSIEDINNLNNFIQDKKISTIKPK